MVWDWDGDCIACVMSGLVLSPLNRFLPSPPPKHMDKAVSVCLPFLSFHITCLFFHHDSLTTTTIKNGPSSSRPSPHFIGGGPPVA